MAKIKVGKCKKCNKDTKQIVVERISNMEVAPVPLRMFLAVTTFGISEMTDEWKCECTICKTINIIENI